tara:strand:- start:219 stop:623 length:405 start_codon:yes stop_codon:yes gene_type:complete
MLAKVKVVIKQNTVGKEDKKINKWKTFATYLFVLYLSFASLECFSQITVRHFNAEWNSANDVKWFEKLKECNKKRLLIEENNNQSKYAIASVPTIIVFKDGEEVKRFQADLSFKMVATREEIQEYIDELIMSDF